MLTPSQFTGCLASWREQGMTLSAIGKQFGVSYQAVQQWISGETQPSKTVLILAEQILRKSPANPR